ncbi:MAG: hypothetical protein SPD11_09275 [Sphaerochaetaceae bacterium]|nr:hypothetical protein [Sphaerochaetaceae bacterium]
MGGGGELTWRLHNLNIIRDATMTFRKLIIIDEVARTGAPGGRQDHDGDGGEMSSRDFFKSMMIQCPLSRSP